MDDDFGRISLEREKTNSCWKVQCWSENVVLDMYSWRIGDDFHRVISGIIGCPTVAIVTAGPNITLFVSFRRAPPGKCSNKPAPVQIKGKLIHFYPKEGKRHCKQTQTISSSHSCAVTSMTWSRALTGHELLVRA